MSPAFGQGTLIAEQNQRYDGRMTSAEHAARTYIAAWLEPERDARMRLLESCFADDGKLSVRGQILRGRAELATAIDAFFADPRRLVSEQRSAVDAGDGSFRFRFAVAYPDGRPFFDMLDVGEVDAGGRITALYTFTEPLAAPDATPPVRLDPATVAAEQAARHYTEVWTTDDRAERAALLESCFAADGRLVGRARTLRGRDAVAAMIESALADPRGLSARRTSAIEAAGTAFRFRSVGEFADGSAAIEGEDAGEIDATGRIGVLYAFTGPLPPAVP
jgi:hypothetical protein